MSSSIPHAIKGVPPETLSSITTTTIPHSKSNIETLPETPLPDYYNLPCQTSLPEQRRITIFHYHDIITYSEKSHKNTISDHYIVILSTERATPELRRIIVFHYYDIITPLRKKIQKVYQKYHPQSPSWSIKKQHRPTPGAALLPPSSNNLQPKSSQKHHPLIPPSKKNTAENLQETSSSHHPPHNFAQSKKHQKRFCYN
jgi:hypothetical protein